MKLKLATLVAWILLNNLGQTVASFSTLSGCMAALELREVGQCVYTP
jgi:hypothetical protein